MRKYRMLPVTKEIEDALKAGLYDKSVSVVQFCVRLDMIREERKKSEKKDFQG